MTKAEVVSEIAQKTGIEKVAVQNVVETFFDVMMENMGKGEDVFFRGFCSFIVKKRERKIARNIAAKTSIVIEPHYVPAFKPAKTFSDEIKLKVKVKKD